jgi:threonine dehydrogenase-like Zn-dependent dehydrogenase
MNAAARVDALRVPQRMKAWVLGGPGELRLVEKAAPQPGAAEVLVRIGATAVCGTDLEVISHGAPALVEGGLPFNKNFTPGHEYMGTVVKLGPGVDEFDVGDRIAVEIHAGCGRCERCREGMYTACLNYGMNNIYVFGIRGEGRSAPRRAAALMAQRRFPAKLLHTHTFPLGEVPTAIRYAAERIEDAIKVVVKMR